MKSFEVEFLFGFWDNRGVMDELYKKLKEYGRVRVNEPMARHTNFKIGGPAAFFVEAKETEKIVGLLNFLRGE
ncbi:MAG: hypothetical protein PHY40_04370, partial [Patescibacteria group bacterium]|nr:hypothetical protein [Patescibacteria group bacterium]